MQTKQRAKRVLVIGGGFGGMVLVKALRNTCFEVFLLDKNNYHTFQPLLYQVATAGLEPDSIATSFRDIFKRQKNFRFRLAEVFSIDLQKKFVRTSVGPIDYDFLVIAAGSQTNYFGMQDFEKHAWSMKSIPEALQLRNLILSRLEEALSEKDAEQRKRLMSVVIVGGGPTGVELAGALGELKKSVLPLDYPELNIQDFNIYLVDMADRLLSAMSLMASKKAAQALKNFGVQILLNSRVKSYDGSELTFSDGAAISAKTVIWTAGVKGTLLSGIPHACIAGGRIKVNAHNQLLGFEDVFVIGDVALQTTEHPKGYPMLAPVAIQQAKLLAENLKRLNGNRPLKPFKYRNLGVMATIGRNHGVVDFQWIKLDGALAWLIWLFVHLMSLVSFRNRLIAFTNWAWNYFTYNRGLRLIIPSPNRSDSKDARTQ